MLYIRTDANTKVASGHVMRCLSIALELQRQGVESTFIITEGSSKELIDDYEFPCITINGVWDNLENEIDELLSLIKLYSIKLLLIDSYFASPEYIQKLSEHTKLIYLGSQEKPFIGVDSLINYSNTLNVEYYLNTYSGQKTKLLLGVEYAPLRDEFFNIIPNVRDEVRNVLLTTGSTDPNNIINEIIRNLKRESLYKDVIFNVIVGSMNSNISSLQQLQRDYPNIVLHYHTRNISKIMTDCDFAISASGTTLYELCACGLPTVCFSISKEQVNGAVDFARNGILLYSGNVNEDKESSIRQIKEYSRKIINSLSLRQDLSKKMKTYIDGKGTKRIVKVILELL